MSSPESGSWEDRRTVPKGAEERQGPPEALAPVFLNYSKQDLIAAAIACLLTNALQVFGIPCFDPHSPKRRTRFRRRRKPKVATDSPYVGHVLGALGVAALMLTIVTPGYMYCQKTFSELRAMVGFEQQGPNRRPRIVPIVFDPSILNDTSNPAIKLFKSRVGLVNTAGLPPRQFLVDVVLPRLVDNYAALAGNNAVCFPQYDKALAMRLIDQQVASGVINWELLLSEADQHRLHNMSLMDHAVRSSIPQEVRALAALSLIVRIQKEQMEALQHENPAQKASEDAQHFPNEFPQNIDLVFAYGTSRRSTSIARATALLFTDLGFQTFCDTTSVYPGRSTLGAMLHATAVGRCLVLVVDESFENSQWARDAVAKMKEARGCPLFTLQLGPVDVSHFQSLNELKVDEPLEDVAQVPMSVSAASVDVSMASEPSDAEVPEVAQSSAPVSSSGLCSQPALQVISEQAHALLAIKAQLAALGDIMSYYAQYGTGSSSRSNRAQLADTVLAVCRRVGRADDAYTPADDVLEDFVQATGNSPTPAAIVDWLLSRALVAERNERNDSRGWFPTLAMDFLQVHQAAQETLTAPPPTAEIANLTLDTPPPLEDSPMVNTDTPLDAGDMDAVADVDDEKASANSSFAADTGHAKPEHDHDHHDDDAPRTPTEALMVLQTLLALRIVWLDECGRVSATLMTQGIADSNMRYCEAYLGELFATCKRFTDAQQRRKWLLIPNVRGVSPLSEFLYHNHVGYLCALMEDIQSIAWLREPAVVASDPVALARRLVTIAFNSLSNIIAWEPLEVVRLTSWVARTMYNESSSMISCDLPDMSDYSEAVLAQVQERLQGQFSTMRDSVDRLVWGTAVIAALAPDALAHMLKDVLALSKEFQDMVSNGARECMALDAILRNATGKQSLLEILEHSEHLKSMPQYHSHVQELLRRIHELERSPGQRELFDAVYDWESKRLAREQPEDDPSSAAVPSSSSSSSSSYHNPGKHGSYGSSAATAFATANAVATPARVSSEARALVWTLLTHVVLKGRLQKDLVNAIKYVRGGAACLPLLRAWATQFRHVGGMTSVVDKVSAFLDHAQQASVGSAPKSASSSSSSSSSAPSSSSSSSSSACSSSSSSAPSSSSS